MSCYNPIYALDLGVLDSETGKRKVRILPKRADEYSLNVLERKFGHGNILSLPCGKCIGCKLDYAKQWATRCTLESRLHDRNCFVTLTYNDSSYLVRNPRLDFKQFIKKLRNDGIKVRYFACAEPGEHTKRWHLHAILFGYMPNDLDPFSCNPNGDWTFTSKEILKYWDKGHVLIGEVTFESAGYVARYCAKKTSGDSFVMMSTHPGIGANYILDNMDKIYSEDKIFGNFGSMKYVKPPRYADKLLERRHPIFKRLITDKRLLNTDILASAGLLSSGLCWHEELLAKQEDQLLTKVQQLKRSL